MMRPKPSNDKVILYTISVNNGLGANGLVKKILMSQNVIFEERNREHLLCPCRLIKLCAMVQKRIRAPTDARETAHHSSYSPSIPKQNSVELGNYGLALEKHKARHNDKVEKWREALVEVGNILGEHAEGQQSTFIQNTMKLFREKLAAKFPECRLPEPERSVLRGSSSSNVKVILYTTSANNDLDANGWAKKVLLSGKVVFEERNCSKEPIYLKELEELVVKEKVILYKISVHDGLGANGLVKKILMSGHVVFEERNCSQESEYMRDLEELVGNDKVRFPMVIVNGKDLCGVEEVEGLDYFENKQKLISVLKHLYLSARTLENLHDMWINGRYS
ncbi:hypothetical protein ACET3Z_004839 [Daucus carota]